ncbi:MAG: YggS family pyridoxal phosphate-dependent enzyme [Candidatus Auribacterota bacterium]
MLMTENMRDALAHIKQTIAEAAKKSGRTADDVRIMAVTKTHSYEVVQLALDAGISLFGENKVQEAMSKYPEPAQRGYELCMIGHLQSNKAKKAVDFFDMTTSVDSIRLAQELNKHARNKGIRYPVLLEVNIGDEESKSGFTAFDICGLADELEPLESLEIRGLMSVPPYLDDPEEVRPYFIRTREVFERLRQKRFLKDTFSILSMGMSHDYAAAVEEGSTMVRIGTVLFGERHTGGF